MDLPTAVPARADTTEKLTRKMRRNMRLQRPFAPLLKAPIVSAACSPREVDDYLAMFDPTWAVRRVRARVVAVQPEAGNATSLFLLANNVFAGFLPGQYARLSFTIDGARHTRCFSFASAPKEPLLRFTIKHHSKGRVSEFVRTRVRPGLVIDLSQAMGTLLGTQPPPGPLLMVAGGSGITPMRSILVQLLHDGHRARITCLHYARGEPTFGDELEALAEQYPHFRYVPLLSAVDPTHAHARKEPISAGTLQQYLSGNSDGRAYLCGSAGFVEAAERALRSVNCTWPRLVERFTPALPRTDGIPKDVDAKRQYRLEFARAGRSIEAAPSMSLLALAERAGLSPSFGCRMGICHSCNCRKISGTVIDELSGVLSDSPNEDIRLCVSAACSDVVLDL